MEKSKWESWFERTIRVVAAACIGAGVLAFVPSVVGAAPHAGVSASVPSCETSALVVWLDTRSTGVPGGWYYNLEFTNLGRHACTLEGYPPVSAVDLAGHQVGRTASRNPAHAPSLITLASATAAAPIDRADTATVVLKIADVGVYGPSACGYTSVAGLRVTPPNQTTATIVPYPFTACARTGPIVLTVEAVQPGVIPG